IVGHALWRHQAHVIIPRARQEKAQRLRLKVMLATGLPSPLLYRHIGRKGCDASEVELQPSPRGHPFRCQVSRQVDPGQPGQWPQIVDMRIKLPPALSQAERLLARRWIVEELATNVELAA